VTESRKQTTMVNGSRQLRSRGTDFSYLPAVMVWYLASTCVSTLLSSHRFVSSVRAVSAMSADYI
jgi:hypothetical protein